MIVTFSDENQYFTIPHNTDEDRSRGMMYFRDLIKNCERAEKNIVDAINENCTNKIILMLSVKKRHFLEHILCSRHRTMLQTVN